MEDCSLLTLPHVTLELAQALADVGCSCLPQLMEALSSSPSAAGAGKGRRAQQQQQSGELQAEVLDVLTSKLSSGQVREILQVRTCTHKNVLSTLSG